MLAKRPSMAWITRKGSSAASWVCVSRTCASLPTFIFSSTRAWRTASGSASCCGKFRKGNQTPAAELAPPRPEVAELAPRIWRVIDDVPFVTAVTHKDADGDTLGSALALALTLEPLGKSVPVLSSPPVPGAWWFLPGIERVNRNAPPGSGPVFIFDASDPSRAGAYESVVTQAPVVVNIDHHVSNTRFATINLVSTEASSTGELVYDLLVWGSISQAGLRDSGATTDQADSAIDQLNTVRGQELAILFKEAGPRVTKVSIRSRDQVDAAELAAKFGGGGHRRAAGIELALPLKEAEARVLAEVRARMNDLE